MHNRNSHIWPVDAATWDLICDYTRMMENAEISQQDYLDKLRSLGMPPDARPGSDLRIVLQPKRTISAPTLAKLNGGVLPGLPH
jgi:hypothetical protein